MELLCHIRAAMAAATLVAACAPALPGQALPVVRTVEVLRVGGADAPEYAAFSEEPVLIADRDGLVYARIPNEALVRVFDRTGAYVRSVGRRGEGPGEFVVAMGHGLVGDTLWIRNWPLPRMSLFTQAGTHVRTWRTPVDIGRRFSLPEGVTALLAGDRAALVPDAVPTGAESRVPLPVVIGDRGLAGGDTVAFVIRPQGMLLPRVGSFRFAPFPSSPLVAIASDGSGLVIVSWTDDAPDRLEVQRVSPAGTTAWRRQLTMPVTAVPRRVQDSLVATAARLARSPVEAARRQGRLPPTVQLEALVRGGLHMPPRYPPVRRVVAGLDGTVWLERFSMSGPSRWLVLDRTGQASFEAELRSGINLHGADGGTIWATETTDDGVPFMLWLRFTVPGSGG
jgi:hypothetical protein